MEQQNQIVMLPLRERLYPGSPQEKNPVMMPGWAAPGPFVPQGADYEPTCTSGRDGDPTDTLSDISVAMRLGQPIFITGPTGCGKTTAAKYFCRRLNWPCYEVTGHSRLEFPELVGGWRVNQQGGMMWHDGPLTSAMRTGGMLLINEADLLDPSTAAGLNSVLDGSSLLIPETGELVQPHELFRVVCTGNSNGTGDQTGTYMGVLRQNGALMGRFLISRARYLPEVREKRVIADAVRPADGGEPMLPGEVIDKIANYCTLARRSYMRTVGYDADAPASSTSLPDSVNGLDMPVTTRDAIRWAQASLLMQGLAAAGVPPLRAAAERAFIWRGSPAAQAALCQLYDTVFGK